MNFLERIPIGRYVPGHSPLHRLDPRSKLLFVTFFIILVFWASESWTYALLIVLTLLAAALSRLSFSYLLGSLKPVFWLILLTAVIHIFTTEGGTLVFGWKWIHIYEEGIRQAVKVSVQITLLMVMASLLTLTTSPVDLTDGLEKLLNPFTRLGLPAHELALMMSVALRFIPTLLEETDKIMKAQMSRGADFDSGSILKRAGNMVPLLIPLFISAFRRAEELAVAMESRGYRGAEGRTKLRMLQWSYRDVGLLGCSLVMVVLFAIIKWRSGIHG